MDLETNEQSFGFLSPSVSVFEKIVRESLRVQVSSHQPLTGGVSGAEVYRILVKVAYPTKQLPRKSRRIVVKLSDHRLFEIEREKFKSLPRSLRTLFVKFDAPKKLVEGYAVLLMPYLEDFDTLEEILFTKRKNVQTEELADLLFKSMVKLQFSDGGLKKNLPNLIAHRLYFSEIEKSFLKVIGIHREFRDKVETLIDMFETLSTRSQEFQPPFMTRIHGDCHSRNFMINPRNLRMKLIDIDAMEAEGDYILDFGELFADIRFYVPTKFYRDSQQDASSLQSASGHNLIDSLQERLGKLATKQYHDLGWEKRLLLAQIRFLLQMLPVIDPADRKKVEYLISEIAGLLKRTTEM